MIHIIDLSNGKEQKKGEEKTEKKVTDENVMMFSYTLALATKWKDPEFLWVF